MIKEFVKGLFTTYSYSTDINKDENNKGTEERYIEIMTTYLDDELTPEIDNLVDKVVVPSTMLETLIGYAEQQLGVDLYLGNSDTWRRLIVQQVNNWYRIKGTKKCYSLLFKMIGFDVEITEVFNSYRFDSSVTFDDAGRRFDMYNPTCSGYNINLLGSVTINPDIVKAIFSIIDFNEPINATLLELTYNGGELVTLHITVEVNAEGDLVYNNDYDPDLILTLVDGDLIIEGQNKHRYHIDGNGDLIFTI